MRYLVSGAEIVVWSHLGELDLRELDFSWWIFGRLVAVGVGSRLEVGSLGA